MAKAISYSLYLLRKRVTPEKALRDLGSLKKFEAKPGRNHQMTLYWKEPSTDPDEPLWLQKLKGEFQGPRGDYSGPALSCVAIFRTTRLFALTFGSGHFLLDEASLEHDFGLLACIGAMSEGALRAVDRRRLEVAPINLSTQASLDLTAGEMDLLDSLDLVKRLKGRIDVDVGLGKKFKLGRTIQGSQALKFSTKVDLSQMPAIANEALASYQNDRHPFLREAVQVLRPVSDPQTIDALDSKLSEDIFSATPSATLLLSPPIVLDEAVVDHYQITGVNQAKEYAEFPGWDEYRKALGDERPDQERMKAHRIVAYKGPEDFYRKWSVWDCLSVEYTVGAERYVLDDGSWYSITQARYSADLKAFKGAVVGSELPPWDGKDEKDYLRDDLGKALGWTILDRTYAVAIAGSRFEPCDAINPATKTIYHLKRRDCGPSGLSHLFRQAIAGAQFSLTDPKVLAEINKRIANRGGDFEIADPREWTVVIGIMMREGDEAGDLPYFSVASGVAALRQFGLFGIKVRIEFIPFSPKRKPQSAAA